MSKILSILFTIISFLPIATFAQEEQWEIERKERIAFSNTLDSLFLQGEYHAIIDLCNASPTATTCAFNLIAVHYFLGDSVTSYRLLDNQIAAYKSDAYSLDNLLTDEYTSYKKFLLTSSAKSYIVNKMDSIYRKESHTDIVNGLELLHLLVEDQWMRKKSSLYDKLNPERKFPLPSVIDSLDAIQEQAVHNIEVYNFYKKHNKVFSKSEVGRIIAGSQMFLFFHELDMERRKFYHQLVIDAVEKGVLQMKDRANFEARTEYLKLGIDEFFKRKKELEESYKKKYSLPDDYRIRLM